MSGLKILVVGASIAGPTAAYWLAKAGADVTVIERFPELRTNGQNIDIRTAGVTVMRKMPGMEAAVRANTIGLEGMTWVGADNQTYGTLKATGNPDQQAVLSEYEIYRGKLSQVLFDLTKDNEHIKYIFGEQVASMQQNEKNAGPILVEFANGSPASEFDLVVACDGANSRTRALGFGCSIRDHVHSINCWTAFFSIKQDMLNGSSIGQGYSAVGGRFISLKHDLSGVTRVMLMSIHPRKDYDATKSFREATKQGDDALKEVVIQRYKGGGWRIDEVLEGMKESDDFYASEIVQVKTPKLYKGRFVLAGDAGYAAGPTGGGTSLALAGAYILAGEIGKHRGDLAAGLQGYEEQMRPLITEMHRIPPFVPDLLAPQTAWGIWLRNNIFAFIIWTGIIDFAQRFFAGALANTNEFKLPTYEWVC